MWEFDEKRAATRYRTRLLCRISLLDTGAARGASSHAPVGVGYTRDISATGLAIIVSSISASYGYLTDLEATLLVELELPTGQLEIKASPVRIQRLGEEGIDRGYLVGLHIRQINDGVRERFEQYLYTLG
ncbi:MAG TPA: PilZ domain-containing protein [Pyrinomonadaceae bacterium]|jgi:hypothetical protein